MSQVIEDDSVAKNALIESKKFRRPNKAVGLRVSGGGSLTLLSRKIFNVLMYHTQKLGIPGLNAPTDLPQFQKYYWVPLPAFMDDVKYNSNDIKYLSESLNNLLSVKLHSDDAGGIGSESLLAGFRITSKTGQKGAHRWIGWALPPGVEALAMNPLLYTTASLYYLTALKSSHSLGLYETCKRYATCPGGLTMKMPLEWWHEHLRGLPVGTAMPEYKIFKRDVLRPAVEEINSMTDVDVELIEIKNGRKIVDLQFKVAEKIQAQFLLPPPVVMLNMELVDRLILIGFVQREAEDILADNTNEFVKATLDLVEHRISNTSLAPLASGAAFFRSATKDRYIDRPSTAKKAAQIKRAKETAAKTTDVVPTDPVKDAARLNALAKYDAMNDVERETLVNQAAEKNPLISVMIKKSPNGKTTRSLIATMLMTLDTSIQEA